MAEENVAAGKQSLDDEELEEGELSDEDNEFPDSHGSDPSQSIPAEDISRAAAGSPDKSGNQQKYSEENIKKGERTDESLMRDHHSNEDSDDGHKRRKKRKKEKDRRKRRREDGKDKSKKKKRKYVDHDKVDDEFAPYQEEQTGWSGFGGTGAGRSPPGPYDSPRDSGSDSYDEHERWPRAPPGGYGGRPAPGPYDSPYESPPGAYDSPSDDEYGPPPKLKRMVNIETTGTVKRGLLGVAPDDYIDANVAANEREELFDRSRHGSKSKKGEKGPRHKEAGRQRDREPVNPPTGAQSGKKRELEKPACRYYMEGKCSKGYDCPFKHDFRPPKKPEVCKFYISDSCTKGMECLYLHGEFPCRFYHNLGNCARGEGCKFSHGDLNPDSACWLEKSQTFIEREEAKLEKEGLLPPGSSDPVPFNKSLLTSGYSVRRDNGEEMKKIPSLFDIEVFPPSSQSGTQPTSSQPSQQSQASSQQPHQTSSQSNNFYENQSHQSSAPPPSSRPSLLGPGPGIPQTVPRAPLLPAPTLPAGPPGPPHNGPILRTPGTGQQGFYNYFPQNNAPGEALAPPVLHQQRPPGPAGLLDLPHHAPDLSQQPQPPLGSGFDVNHLPPKPRELFLRIQQQQRSNTVNIGPDAKQDAPDDDWYSDDDEEKKAGGPHQPKPPEQPMNQPGAPNIPGAPAIDIATMLTAIRQSMGPQAANNAPSSGAGNTQRDPRSTPIDPRKARASNQPSDSELEIKCYGVKVKYMLRRITVEGRPSLPPHLIKHDPKYKDDPRVDKYYQPNITPVPRSMSDRHGHGTKPPKSDPRLLRKGNSGSHKEESNPSSALPQSSQPTHAMGMPLPLSGLSKPGSVPGSPGLKSPPIHSGQSPPSIPAELLKPPPIDLKTQRTLSIDAALSPPLSMELPKLPDALKEGNKPSPIRQRSNSDGSSGNMSDSAAPHAAAVKTGLDYRNDPRFRKKKSLSSVNSGVGVGESEGALVQEGQASPQSSTITDSHGKPDEEADMGYKPGGSFTSSRRDELEFASPLAAHDLADSSRDSYSGGYNRPPNDNFTKFQQERQLNNSDPRRGGWGGRGRGKGLLKDPSTGGGGSPTLNPPTLPNQSMVTISQEQMDTAPSLTSAPSMMSEPSLKDMFKTIDPTASPFC